MDAGYGESVLKIVFGDGIVGTSRIPKIDVRPNSEMLEEQNVESEVASVFDDGGQQENVVHSRIRIGETAPFLLFSVIGEFLFERGENEIRAGRRVPEASCGFLFMPVPEIIGIRMKPVVHRPDRQKPGGREVERRPNGVFVLSGVFETVGLREGPAETVERAVERISATLLKFACEALTLFERHFREGFLKELREGGFQFCETRWMNGEFDADSGPKGHAVVTDGFVLERGDFRIEKDPVFDGMRQFLRSAERERNPNPDVQGGEGLMDKDSVHAKKRLRRQDTRKRAKTERNHHPSPFRRVFS